MAISGSGLENNWVNPAYPSAGPSLYNQFVTFIQARMAQFEATELAAIVWIQGEADCGESPDADNYRTNLTTFFTNLRSVFGNFAIVLNRVTSRYDPAGGASPVRSHQEAFAALTSNTGIVYCDDLGMRDAAHFTDDGYATLGVRFAASVLATVNATAPASPRWLAAGPAIVAGSAQSLTPAWPAGHQAGDRAYLILSGLGTNNYTLATAAGFTEIADSPQRDPGNSLNARLHVWECVATSSAQAAPTIADVASDDAKMAVIVVVRGGSSLAATAGSALGTAATAASAPGLTTTSANNLVVHILAPRIDSASSQADAWANASLTGVTEQMDLSTLTGAGYGVSIATGYKAAAGAVSAASATLATASTQAAITLAIAP
jgi:hypothetical protein